MTARIAKFSTLLAALSGLFITPHATAPSFDALAPDVVLTPGERASLDSGGTIVRVSTTPDGYLSLTGIVRADVSRERVVRWTASVEALQRGKYVPEIGRFSAPPRVADLSGLTIDAGDLDDLARCRPGDCGVKLSAGEIAAVTRRRQHVELDARFRELLVRRATQYLAHGLGCAMPFEDHPESVTPAAAFETVLQRLEFFPRVLPSYTDYLRTAPGSGADDGARAFLYWTKEDLGMKPIINITHFSAAHFDTPGLPEVVVVAKQVYASHYKNASMTMTALVADGGGRYLVYINRSHVDAFDGLFGGLVRRTIERRVKREAPGVLQNLRKRLESGDPPA